jgi:isopentenyl diphosphate isomerase/L-lactate dehydrogenase-like FMN-dependent dehydrogenase
MAIDDRARPAILAPAREPDPRVKTVVSLSEFEAIARDRMHPGAHDFVAGGAWAEETLADNVASWKRYRLVPRVLVDDGLADPRTTILGRASAMPVTITPMAAMGLAHPEGEVAVARAAAAAGIPMILSTVSSRSIEEVAAAAPDAVRFFQLYTQRSPTRGRELVERAVAGGYRAIVLTVDLPVLGYRARDLRNEWKLDVPLGNLDEPPDYSAAAPAIGPDPALDPEAAGAGPSGWDVIEEVRSWSDLPLVVKGVLSPADALEAVARGVDGIGVSNHGARQLDRVPAPIDVLEGIKTAVAGRAELWVDGGVRSGLDIPIALALGARSVLIGRPIYWALAAGGAAGVEKALTILREELTLAMTLLGAPSPDRVERGHIMAASDGGRPYPLVP